MTDTSATLQRRLDAVAIHGPGGRIASVRALLGMQQVEFGRAVGVGRETISHWENVDKDGKPRQRATRRSGRAIVALVKERLGIELRPDTFFEEDETPFEAVVREQRELRKLVKRLLRSQHRLAGQLDEALDLLTGLPSVRAEEKTASD